VEYANIVHDMVGVLLKRWYKGVTKDAMEANKNGMDYDYIESFDFPAKYENQKYADDLGLMTHIVNGEEWDIEKAYKNHCI